MNCVKAKKILFSTGLLLFISCEEEVSDNKYFKVNQNELEVPLHISKDSMSTENKTFITSCSLATSDNEFLVVTPIDSPPPIDKKCGDGKPYRSPVRKVNYNILNHISNNPDLLSMSNIQATSIHASILVEWKVGKTYLIGIRENQGEWFVSGKLDIELISEDDFSGDLRQSIETDAHVIDLPSELAVLKSEIDLIRDGLKECHPNETSSPLTDNEFYNYVRGEDPILCQSYEIPNQDNVSDDN